MSAAGRWLVSPEAGGGALWQVVDMLSAYRSSPMPRAELSLNQPRVYTTVSHGPER